MLELYEDRPTDFEAWDLDPFHLETRSDCPPAASAEVAWPTRCAPRSRSSGRSAAASRMRQTVRLDAESSRLEFHCAIDWHEDRRALKVRFPVAVHAPRATYEMQFGVVERPTHYSTRRDLAQFEVPGHRFADLSEHGFGVALLSAATYGWSVHGDEMRMTLLRSPRWPDPEADVGHHELAFAIYPHAGGWQDAGVTAEALRFNAPLLLGAPAPASRAPGSPPTPRASSSTRSSAPRTATTSSSASTRPTAAAAWPACASASRSARPGSPTCWRTASPSPRWTGDEVVMPYRPFEIVTVALAR